jgi:hypothetical protein
MESPVQPQNQPVDPLPQTPPPTQSSSLPIIILSVFVVLCLAAIGYLFWQNQQLMMRLTSNKIPVPVQIPVSQAEPSFVPTMADVTANWKTYSDAKYEFSFRYPQNLSSKTGTVAAPYTGVSVPITSFSDPKTVREGTDAPFNGFSMYVVTDMKATSFDAYVSQELTSMNQSVNAFMQGAKKVSLTNGQALATDSRGYYYLPFPDNKQVLVFAYIQADRTFKPDFDRILSTVKFTGQTSNGTSGLKTYTDPAGKYNFPIPAGYTVINAVPDSFVGTMLEGVKNNCRGPVLQNTANPGVLIVFEVVPADSDGGYCWSNGYFTDDNKWRSSEPLTSWKGDYFEMKSPTAKNSSLMVSVGLANKGTYTLTGEDALNQIVHSFQFTGK